MSATVGLPDDRIARRERIARVAPEESTVDKVGAKSVTVVKEPAVGERPSLEPRTKATKVPLSTRISGGTEKRLQKFIARGYAVTDVVDHAIIEFLDRNGG